MDVIFKINKRSKTYYLFILSKNFHRQEMKLYNINFRKGEKEID